MHIDIIRELFEKGDFKTALDKIPTLDNKDQLEGMLFRSKILLKLGNYNRALKFASETLQQSNVGQIRNLEANITISLILTKQGKLDESLRILEKQEKI